MTLEEAIEQCERLVIQQRNLSSNHGFDYGYFAERNNQLVEWLRELKYYKDRQDLINKSWQELISYKKGIEKIKIRSQAYRECGEIILANGMEQALDILEEVNADGKHNNILS